MNSVSANNALTSSRFTTFLSESHPLGKPQGYLCLNSATKIYNVYFKPKQSHQFEKGFSPLSFRQIIILGFFLYPELSKHPEEAVVVSKEIQRMNERKVIKERNRGYLSQFSWVISDCSRNLFKGYGFKTTLQLAMELSWDLAQIAAKAPKPPVLPVVVVPQPVPIAHPQPVPALVPQILTIADSSKLHPTQTPVHTAPTPSHVKPKVSFSIPPTEHLPEPESHPISKQPVPPPSQPVLPPAPVSNTPSVSPPIKLSEASRFGSSSYTRLPDRPPPIQRTNSVLNKKQALSAYKDDPLKCPKLCKTVIWMEINEIDNERPFPQDEVITTMVHLMMYVSGSKELDLKNEKCGQVVVDTFDVGKKLICAKLVQWLKKKKSFHPALLGKCLAIFVEKSLEGGSNSAITQEPLVQLLQIYRESDWNSRHHTHHKSNSPVLPINDPVLIDALIVMLKNEPNLDFGTSFVDWGTYQGFDASALIKLVRVYKDLEELKGANLNDLYYPTRDKIVEFIKHNSEIKTKVFADSSVGDIVDYLRKKGVQ